MVTAAQWGKLALSLPDTEQKSHFEQPDFRVHNKIFAGLNRDGTRGNLKLGPELQRMLRDARPDAFEPAAGAWGRSGWTYVELARVELEEIRELMLEAWRLVAPKRLVAAGEQAKSPARDPARSKRTARAKSATKRKPHR